MAAVVSDLSINVACSGPAAGFTVPAKTTMNILAATPANLAAQNTKIAALEAAYEPLTLGVVRNTNLGIAVPVSSAAVTGTAPRGDKWAISAVEVSGDLNTFTYTIPAADDAGTHVITGTITADLGNADWIAFKNAFDAVAVSPAGIALSLKSAKLVGRRS